MDEKDMNLGNAENMQEIDVGSVRISPDVVSAIAFVATTEIDGIAGMAQNITGGIAELLGKKNATRGIKVEINEGVAAIDAYIIVQYGAIIPDVSGKLQEKIKQNVETMTGIKVDRVNVHVQGVKFETNEAAPEGGSEPEKNEPLKEEPENTESTTEGESKPSEQ